MEIYERLIYRKFSKLSIAGSFKEETIHLRLKCKREGLEVMPEMITLLMNRFFVQITRKENEGKHHCKFENRMMRKYDENY